MTQLILSSEWFMSHGDMSGTTNLVFRPGKHIELIAGSSNNQVIGRAIFCLDGDTEIVTTTGTKTLSELSGKEINVISVDELGNKVISDGCRVEPTIKADVEYRIELYDGTTIKCTENHKFLLVDGTYKAAKDLTADDELAEIQYNKDMTYASFIQNIIDTRGQWNIPDGEYCEAHHIIPRCMGGDGNSRAGGKPNKHKNIIWLYAHEHFIAHKLLALENPDNKSLVLAWSMMAFPKGKTSREFEISPMDYEILRKIQSKAISGENSHFFGRDPWNKGKTNVYSNETLKKIRAPRPNARGKKKQPEQGKKISAAAKRRYIEHPETFAKPTLNKVCITDGTTNKYICRGSQIPDGFEFGQTKIGYTIRDQESYSKQKSELVSGNKNPMYSHGERISGGKNGHAIYVYTYCGVDYQCRDDLMIVLKREFPTISESTIRRIMSGTYTQRITKKYQEVIDKLTWRPKKDENQINK